MAYQIRAYSKSDKTVHDIKDFNFENGLNMISTHKDIELNLDNTEYIVIQSNLLSDILGQKTESKITKKTVKKKTALTNDILDDKTEE